jgi:hypothetical protein
MKNTSVIFAIMAGQILKPSVPDPRIIYLIFATFAPKAFSVGAAYL